MKEQLRYWRDLSKQNKKEIKERYSITVVTFEFIEKLYKLKK